MIDEWRSFLAQFRLWKLADPSTPGYVDGDTLKVEWENHPSGFMVNTFRIRGGKCACVNEFRDGRLRVERFDGVESMMENAALNVRARRWVK